MLYISPSYFELSLNLILENMLDSGIFKSLPFWTVTTTLIVSGLKVCLLGAIMVIWFVCSIINTLLREWERVLRRNFICGHFWSAFKLWADGERKLVNNGAYLAEGKYNKDKFATSASCSLKGIVHQFLFYCSNLIFWIVMWCGIADFDRRGL